MSSRTNSRSPIRQRTRSSPSPPPALRTRLNSKDIPRTYSGLYGLGGELTHQTPNSELLPFELSRNCNTAWLCFQSCNKRSRITSSSLFWIYIFFIVLFQFTVMVLPLPFDIPFETSWTVSNVAHGILTLLFFHWIKGSPNFYEQGELNAMTLWEQLSSAPDSSVNAAQSKTVLILVPTVLCYMACHFGMYDKVLSLINVSIWLICVVAKLEGMNGVRIWGINRTIGIDDDMRKLE